MAILPTEEQIKRTVGRFQNEDPFYRLPAEYGDPNYYVYRLEDAAWDTLEDEGYQKGVPFFPSQTQVLAAAAEKEIENYPLILKMRFGLQRQINIAWILAPEWVDQQG